MSYGFRVTIHDMMGSFALYDGWLPYTSDDVASVSRVFYLYKSDFNANG